MQTLTRAFNLALVAFERQNVVTFAINNLPGDPALATHGVNRYDRILDLNVVEMSSGMAVISLDFSSLASCPRLTERSTAQALTSHNAPKLLARSWLRRSTLPSIAI